MAIPHPTTNKINVTAANAEKSPMVDTACGAAIGWPHFGQAAARADAEFLQTGQVIKPIYLIVRIYTVSDSLQTGLS